jgi:hypothetical protein
LRGADDGEKVRVFAVRQLPRPHPFQLYRDFGIVARGLVELGALARAADPPRTATDAAIDVEPTANDAELADTAAETAVTHAAGATAAGAAPVAAGTTPTAAAATPIAAGSLTPNGFPYTRRVVALAKLVALYTGRQLLKDDVRTSDWERNLDANQQRCASVPSRCRLRG